MQVGRLVFEWCLDVTGTCCHDDASIVVDDDVVVVVVVVDEGNRAGRNP